MGTLSITKKPPTYGHGDTLYCQKKTQYESMWTLCTAKKALYIWARGDFGLLKRPLLMGTGRLCTTEKPPIHGHGDTVPCQKRPLYMGMWTLYISKKPPT